MIRPQPSFFSYNPVWNYILGDNHAYTQHIRSNGESNLVASQNPDMARRAGFHPRRIVGGNSVNCVPLALTFRTFLRRLYMFNCVPCRPIETELTTTRKVIDPPYT